jgi:non-ribosomal peptide synthase protein (TIGR01720 family)
MSDLADRIAALPPARRQLLDALLQHQPGARPASTAYVAPRTTIEATLAAIWATVLGVERVGVHDSFFDLGGDSIQSIQIVAKARRAGLHLTNTQLFEQPTIARLAPVVSTASAEEPMPLAATGEIPLTPIQHWFFGLNLRNVHHWNQAVLLRTAWDGGDERTLRRACTRIGARDEALRVRFRQEDGVWRQIAGQPAEQMFSAIDLTALDDVRQEQSLSRLVDEAQRSLHLTDGPLMRVIVIRRRDRDRHVLLVAHHLIADAVSFRLLVDDLAAARDQRHLGETSMIGSGSAPFSAWSRHLQALAASPALVQEVDYWRAQLADVPPPPIDYPGGRNRERDAHCLTERWDTADTAALRGAHDRLGGSVYECLLAALALTLTSWTGERRIGLWLEGHGRDDEALDLTHTIGWLTTLFPLRVDVAGSLDPARVVSDIQRSLRTVPRKGLGFGVLRYLSRDAEVRAALSGPGPDVLFNYLGVLDEGRGGRADIRVEREMAGRLYDPDGERPQRLQIYGGIVRDQLVLHWAFSTDLHRIDTIQTLAGRFRSALRAVIESRHEAMPGAEDEAPAIHIDPSVPAEDVAAVLAQQERGD